MGWNNEKKMGDKKNGKWKKWENEKKWGKLGKVKKRRKSGRKYTYRDSKLFVGEYPVPENGSKIGPFKFGLLLKSLKIKWVFSEQVFFFENPENHVG